MKQEKKDKIELHSAIKKEAAASRALALKKQREHEQEAVFAKQLALEEAAAQLLAEKRRAKKERRELQRFERRMKTNRRSRAASAIQALHRLRVAVAIESEVQELRRRLSRLSYAKIRTTLGGDLETAREEISKIRTMLARFIVLAPPPPLVAGSAGEVLQGGKSFPLIVRVDTSAKEPFSSPQSVLAATAPRNFGAISPRNGGGRRSRSNSEGSRPRTARGRSRSNSASSLATMTGQQGKKKRGNLNKKNNKTKKKQTHYKSKQPNHNFGTAARPIYATRTRNSSGGGGSVSGYCASVALAADAQLPIAKHQAAIGALIGKRGANAKCIKAKTGARISVRGVLNKRCGNIDDKHPSFVSIEGVTVESVRRGVECVRARFAKVAAHHRKETKMSYAISQQQQQQRRHHHRKTHSPPQPSKSPSHGGRYRASDLLESEVLVLDGAGWGYDAEDTSSHTGGSRFFGGTAGPTFAPSDHDFDAAVAASNVSFESEQKYARSHGAHAAGATPMWHTYKPTSWEEERRDAVAQRSTIRRSSSSIDETHTNDRAWDDFY